jgi:hypothetical protein
MASFPLVYCVNTSPWLRELGRQQQGGPVALAEVPEARFHEWQRLGFSHIWLLGVWQTGPRARAVALNGNYREALADCTDDDVQSSPFAIADYRVADALGGEAGLAAFRKRLHRHGLKLMLDFVPNHMGLDHTWVRDRPELFVNMPPNARGAFRQQTRSGEIWLAHGRDPNFPPWVDTVQLDYRRPATHQAMTELLVSVCSRCDAVRCDMAMLVLREVLCRVWPDEAAVAEEFWPLAIQTVKALCPECVFLAEAYWGLEQKLLDLGFDYTYDKILYDCLMAPDATAVQSHLYSLSPEFLARSAHFLENHDEARVSELLSLQAHKAAAFLMLCLPGLRLLNDGQLAGARVRTPVQLARRCQEMPDTDIIRMYGSLLSILHSTPVGEGTGELLRSFPTRPDAERPTGCVLVSWRAEPGEVFLCAVNLTDRPNQCLTSICLGDNATRVAIRDLLTGAWLSIDRTTWRSGTLRLDLVPFATHLLHVKRL